MSAVDREDEEKVIEPAGPGSRLRAAREAQGLDIGRVSAHLHLAEDILIALEADDYGKLPGAVFVQGYLRNYARMMGMSAEPLLEAFQQANAYGKQKTKLKISNVRREVRSSHAVVRSITWLIILGLIALVVVWWQGYLQWPVQVGDGATNSVDEQQAAIAEVITPQAEVPVLMGTPEIREEVATTESDTSTMSLQVAADPAETGEVNSVAPVEVEVAEPRQAQEESMPLESVAANPAEGAMPVVESVTSVSETTLASTEVSSAAGAEVVVTFKDSCWVDIKDADRSHRIFGVKPAGARLTLEGNPPYSFVIGNAAAVEITVKGELFDLSEHTRANVARFTLDPE
ncbi:MAG: helix-turn-helix domain-containing protein [Candidatus Sedimenticola sp. (ex Thyasira tokunagai)]